MLVAKLFGFLVFILHLDLVFTDDDKQDLYGCGGFIKSDVEIDFSQIKVRVYTKQGTLKDTTECAPNNGYYMIPVYSKGEFVLKVEGPEGWTFEPSSIDLLIDGVTDKCTLSQNINFRFIGFGVVGKVVSKGQSSGPEGVKLVLKLKDGDVVGEAFSSPGGDYTFKNVLPGSYVVEAFHQNWKFDNSKSPVTVGKQTGVVDKQIIVAGFDIQGSILSDGEPVSGVNFLLYKTTTDFNTKDKILNCSTEKLPHEIPSIDGSVYLCYVTSNGKGLFEFPSVVTGAYTLMPMYKNEQISYDVSPSRLNVIVAQDSLIIKEPFLVAGFGVSGFVKTSAKGTGIPNVRVFVNNVEKAITKQDGFFHLGSMKTGSYEIKATKDRLEFDVTKVKVTPSTPLLPDLIVSKFQVCGKILLDKTHTTSQDHKKSRVVEYKNMDGSIHLTTDSTLDGLFCGYLQPGSYKLSVRISDVERDQGFRLMPLEHLVTVTTSVIDDVTFSQFYAKVSGVVQCLEPCGTLFLTLMSTTKSDEYRQVDVTADEGKREISFLFEGVMAGAYELSIQNENWCWSQKTLKVSIIDEDVKLLKFVQSGYLVVTSLSHKAKLIFKKIGKPETNKTSPLLTFEVSPGLNKFCLEESGEFDVKVESCHRFDPDVYNFDTSVGGVMMLTATLHPIEILLFTKQPVDPVHALITSLDVRNVESNSVEAKKVGPLVLKSKPDKGADDKETKFEYAFTHWARSDERLSITLQSNVLLFDPNVVDVVASDYCPSGRAEFIGRMGVFIEGGVVPPIIDVDVTVKFEERGRVLMAKTDVHGKYRIGPVDADLKYETSVFKNGYTFTGSPGLPSLFQAYKLAEIVVKVRDVNTGEILPGVLLSLSGSESFRRNNVTNADEEELVFSNLGPGDYFLKPMMKEYEFEPSSYSVKVSEGATVNIDVAAKRVAYSCFALMTSLNGEPEVGVYLEAVSVDGPGGAEGHCQGHQEEGKTGMDGSVRIRGLKPRCLYSLRLRRSVDGDVDANNVYERTSPRFINVQVNNKDIHNVRFVVFRRMNSMDVSGRIVTLQEYVSSVKVHLYQDSNPDIPIHSTTLDISPFFNFAGIPLDDKSYTIKVSSSLSRSMYKYTLPEIQFTANQSYKHFVLHFHVQPKSTEQELTHSSFLVLPVILILLYLCYNYKQILPLVSQYASGLMDTTTSFITKAKSTSKPTQSSQVQQQQQQQQLLESLGISETTMSGDSLLKKRLKAKKI